MPRYRVSKTDRTEVWYEFEAPDRETAIDMVLDGEAEWFVTEFLEHSADDVDKIEEVE